MDLSIIIVCLSTPAIRAKCLDALEHEIGDAAEILVIHHPDDDRAALTSQAHSSVRWIEVPHDLTVPQMRRVGMEQSQGQIIALLEDDCVVASGWYKAIVDATHSSPIIGGAIAPNDYATLLDWAVYFCEFAPYIPPFSGEFRVLPGNNVAYSRELVEDYLSRAGANGFYETFEHPIWQQQGIPLYAHPQMVVYNINHWSARNVFVLPFHHGRGFAGQRFTDPAKRLIYLGVSLILPAVRTLRIAMQVFKRRTHIKQFLMALPWILGFNCSWALGEGVGYLTGAGSSLQKWR